MPAPPVLGALAYLARTATKGEDEVSPEGLTVLSTLVTAAATLAGVAFGSRLQYGREERRELRSSRRLAYIGWLQFAENLGTWAFEPDADFATWNRRLKDTKVELELVASRRVNNVVQDYIDAIDDALMAIENTRTRASQAMDPNGIDVVGPVFADTMNERRQAVLNAMRKDMGIKD